MASWSELHRTAATARRRSRSALQLLDWVAGKPEKPRRARRRKSAASAGAAPVRVDDAFDALALCAAAPRALGAACAAAADGAGAVERSCHALRCGLARRCVGFADAATVRFRLRRRDAARTGVLPKDPFLAALRSCGLHRDFVDERAIDGLASHFAPPPDVPPGAFVAYESFCDALYLCDFDGAWPLVAAASPPARAPPPAFPAAPPSEAEARAQRALARALGGRAHRRRALRARLAAVADGDAAPGHRARPRLVGPAAGVVGRGDQPRAPRGAPTGH